MTRYVVVGNGIAGVTAAQAIARADAGADLYVYAAEPHPYYRRPQLPAYIAGEATEKDITYRPPEWYEREGIHVHLDSPVAELDASAHRVRLSDGSAVAYERLLLATGGWAWTPPMEGAEQRGVFTLRTLDDARAIRSCAGTVEHAVVVGGGLLGLETARALRASGVEVTVVEIADHLLPRQLDREGAAVLQGILEGMAIRVVTGAVAKTVLGDGTAAGLVLEGGQELPAGLVFCSAGWRPEVTLARQAGLEVERGVVVDKHLRTSAEDVYAAGDVAQAAGRLYGIVPAAIEQARVAAANMVAPGSVAYTGTLPFTTLKVVGAELTSVGNCTSEDEGLLQLRHVDLASRHYRKLVVQDGRLVGAILLNDRERTLPVRRLIEQEADVSSYVDHLLDDDLDLKALAERGQA
jgi:nitrite reductase (NADH) large subunit